SYKSSRVHLKRLPTRSKLVVQGPGENAGIIDIGDGWACAFKIESHNHQSSSDPTLCAKNAQRMGHPQADQATVHRNHSVLEGVVSGIASYGNCFGVP